MECHVIIAVWLIFMGYLGVNNVKGESFLMYNFAQLCPQMSAPGKHVHTVLFDQFSWVILV